MNASSWNDAIPNPCKESPDVINHIKARQGQFFTQEDAKPSPFMNTDLLTKLLSLIDASPSGVDGLTEMRNKVRSKWWGPQGQHAEEAAIAAALAKYYIERPFRPFDVPQEVALAYRIILKNVRGKYEEYSWDDVLEGKVFRKKKTNSGYLGFTSVSEVKLARLRESEAAMDLIDRDGFFYHPAILWYRHQNQKFRTIFGDSLLNLAYGKMNGGFALERALYSIPQVAYYSEYQTATRIAQFIRKERKVTCVEGDYEMMDGHVSLESAIWVMRHVYEYAEWPLLGWARFERLLCMYFTQPLLDYKSDVILGQHSLFSGQFPTNGLEDYINIFAQLMFIYRVSVEMGKDFWYLFEHSLFTVMGDDSFIILPGDDYDPELLKQWFVDTAHLFGQEAQVLKQRVSTRSAWFCKRGYDFYPAANAKRFNSVLVPTYPMDLTLKSITWPESGPQVRYDQDKQPDYSFEIPSIFARFDNAYGDPSWEAVVEAWAKDFGPRDLIRGATLAVQQGWKMDDWMSEVRGIGEFSLFTSFTARFLMKLR